MFVKRCGSDVHVTAKTFPNYLWKCGTCKSDLFKTIWICSVVQPFSRMARVFGNDSWREEYHKKQCEPMCVQTTLWAGNMFDTVEHPEEERHHVTARLPPQSRTRNSVDRRGWRLEIVPRCTHIHTFGQTWSDRKHHRFTMQ